MSLPRKTVARTEMITLRLPTEMRTWLIKEAGRKSMQTGRIITVQSVLLEYIETMMATGEEHLHERSGKDTG